MNKPIVVQITSRCGYGSIGKICQAISELLSNKGIENYILYSGDSNGYKNGIKYCTPTSVRFSALKSRLFGNYGFNSTKDTKRLVAKLDEIKPDIVQLHNLHSHNCNLTILFDYLRKKNIKIFYTFHDCWTFTGYCPYFDMVNCKKWETECHNCVAWKKYSWFFDRSNSNFKKKKDAFKDLNLTIITPSQWLADLTKKSFLGNYPVKVINNGIDLTVFTPQHSDFRIKHHCENKKMLLGVAMGWERRKGLETFIELSKDLPSSSFQIVLVGTTNQIDKLLPSNIISIHKTKDQHELAQIYSAADVLVNPTMEENFPTTNIESIACGTPVITYNSGGSGEMLNSDCGIVIPRGDYNKLYEAVKSQIVNPLPKGELCRKQALHYKSENLFNNYYLEYLTI